MVIDTSAVIAIPLREPEAEHFALAVADDPKRLISYALAKCAGEPLLFKGNDLSQTDVETAYPRP
jgi:uncharacterized protein with PIN domain